MRNMKNKRGKLITVLFVAAMSVSLFTACSDDATITGLDEGALPELASDTRAVTDELIESDSISNFSLLAATEYSDAELKKRIRNGWWKQYSYTLPNGRVTPEISEYTDYTQNIYPDATTLFFVGSEVLENVNVQFSQIGTTPYYYEEINTGFYEFKVAYPVPVFFEFVSKKTGEIIDTIIFFPSRSVQ